MNVSPKIKGSITRKLLAVFHLLIRKSRYFSGNSPQFIRPTLDYILLQLNLNQDIPFLFVAVLIGLFAGYVAVFFHEAIRVISTFSFTGIRSYDGTLFSGKYLMFVLPFIPAVGGLLVGLYNTYVVKARPGHGLASVIKAVAQNDGKIGKSVWFHRTVTSILSIGTGGGGGREAPIAQVGAAIGSAIAQILRFSPTKTRTLLGCGAAAGLAAVFNAPIGGVMFAIEVLLGDFSVKTFSPIVVAAVIGTVISRSFLGNSPTFEVPEYRLVSNQELVFYCLLGVLAGLSAVMFIRIFYIIEEWFEKLEKRWGAPAWSMPAFGGFLTGLVSMWLPGLYGFSYKAINNVIRGHETWTNMVGIYLLKPVVAALTVGSGGSGGMFAPAMKMGAMLGGMFGHVVHSLMPAITGVSGAYALVGMGALTAGVMRAPLTVILILFEVTGNYEIVLPIMFAAVTSSLIARLTYRHTMETYVLEKEGVRVGFGIALSVAEHISISDLVRTDYVRFSTTESASVIVNVFYNTPESDFLVTDAKGLFAGIIRLDEMRVLLQEGLLTGVIAGDILKKDVPVVYEQTKLDEVLKLFEITDHDMLPVIDSSCGRLVGVVRQEEAFAYYRKQLNLYASDLHESEKNSHPA